jgi:hypothetical protein
VSLKTLSDITPGVTLHPVDDRQCPRIITEQVAQLPLVRFVLVPLTCRKSQLSVCIRPFDLALAIHPALAVTLKLAVAWDFPHQRPAFELPVLHPLIHVCGLADLLRTKVGHDIKEVTGRFVAGKEHSLVHIFGHGKVPFLLGTPCCQVSAASDGTGEWQAVRKERLVVLGRSVVPAGMREQPETVVGPDLKSMINREAVSMPWARLDDMLPVHPKIRALSDSAFRLYISAICWSSLHRTDGRVPADQLRFVSDVRRSQVCANQLVQAGLWETADGGWRIHDYLEYQPSAEQVTRERELKRRRQERWRASVDASQDASDDPSQDASSRARAHPIPSHPPSGSVGNQPADHNGRDNILIETIQQAITSRTGRSVTAEQAEAIAMQIIGSGSPRNPASYVRAAIDRDPNPRRFLPSNHPSERSAAEALLIAGISPDDRPAAPETIATIAAQARKSLRRD